MKNLKAKIAILEQRLKVAGWDGEQTDEDPLEKMKADYTNVHWLMKDKSAVYGIDPNHKDFVVALYEKKKEGGQTWLYTKVIGGKSGPFQRPPAKFWDLPQVKEHLPKDYLEQEKANEGAGKSAGWDTRVKDHEHTQAEHESKGEHVQVNWDKLIADSHGKIKNFFSVLQALVGHGVGKVEEIKSGDVLVYFPIAKAGGDIPAEYLTKH